MNLAHLHLILIHAPIILVPFGVLVYLLGLWTKNLSIQIVALYTLILATLFTILAFLSGEGAEDIVEKLVGISEKIVERHEEAGDLALWLTVPLGVLSLSQLVFLGLGWRLSKLLVVPIVISGLISFISLSYAAQTAGKIKHPEAFGESIPEARSRTKEDLDD